MEYFYFLLLVSGIQSELQGECQPCECCRTERCISLDNGDKYCMDGCRDGFIGRDCTSRCALQNCARCLYNNTCEQCFDGYMYSHQGDCQKSCPLCKTCTWPTGYCDSCEPGYYPRYESCEKDDSEGCLVFGDYGRCDKCKQGLWSVKCSSKCSPGCVDGICDMNGYCKCVETYWGTRCDLSCNIGCKDGKCNDRGQCQCFTGFWGETCEYQCSEGCLDECAPDGSCKCKSHAFGERCLYNCTSLCINGKCNDNQNCVCTKGFWGTFCQNECSVGCQNSICDLHGKCECRQHFWGQSCDKECYYGCEDSLCSSEDGTCICKRDYYGNRCERQCEIGCVGDTCSKSGSCQCKLGYWGKQCSFICSLNCLTPSCNKDTGFCQCKLGFWGESCHSVCNTNCRDNICRVDGTCLCKAGSYGKYCNMACSSGCTNSICDIDGNCDCKMNYSGRRCEKQLSGLKVVSNICKQGYFKADGTCTACPYYCINRVCDIETGYCECQPGYWGNRCNNRCSDGCLRELSCLKNGSCECKQNAIGDFCEKCKDGYISYYPGSRCEACPITCGTCEILPSYDILCTSCKPGFFGQTCTDTCQYSCKTCKDKDSCTSCNDGFYGSTCHQPCLHNCPNCDVTKGTCNTSTNCVNDCLTKCSNECQDGEYLSSSTYSPPECTDGKTASSVNNDITCLKNGGKDCPHSTSVSLLVTFGIVNCILLGVIVFIVVIERKTGDSVIKLMYTRWTRRLGRSDRHQATMTEMNARTGNAKQPVYEDLQKTETEGNYSSIASAGRYASNSGNTVSESSAHIYQNTVPLETIAV